ncbi:DUF732 domain-containing protein [Synechocystis sp. PCC 7509]|uniref:DUF732 domain-containing protein n=1 Tax=Synechocystis sp. PCC 7509 TaxID=927677 RepID=UPI0002AC59E3|nr:DUF732 domain-containing protein [Synechocystis sp. PCC 7509]
MNVKYLSAIAFTAICLLPGISYAQEQQDYACFFTTESGRTVDFSQTSLCGAQKAAPKVIANTDEAFLAEYKRNAMQYAPVRDSLLANAEQSPQVSSLQAQKVCSDLKSGLSLDEIKRKQATETVEQSSIVNAQIINNLATKYYCPKAGK